MAIIRAVELNTVYPLQIKNQIDIMNTGNYLLIQERQSSLSENIYTVNENCIQQREDDLISEDFVHGTLSHLLDHSKMSACGGMG